MFNCSLSNKASAALIRKDLNDFLGKLKRYLKEIKIEADPINIISLIEPTVEACQKMSKFSNSTGLKEKLEILVQMSGEAMMVFLGMLNEIMTNGDLLPQDKDLVNKVLGGISRAKFCLSK